MKNFWFDKNKKTQHVDLNDNAYTKFTNANYWLYLKRSNTRAFSEAEIRREIFLKNRYESLKNNKI